MPDTERLPVPAALIVCADRVHALADGRGRPFLSRHEAGTVLAEWTAAMPEGGR
jgi:hypothetical protein